MERVGVLISRLQEQLQQNAAPQNMLVTAQILQNELLIQSAEKNGSHGNETFDDSKAAVLVPLQLQLKPLQERITNPCLSQSRSLLQLLNQNRNLK